MSRCVFWESQQAELPPSKEEAAAFQKLCEKYASGEPDGRIQILNSRIVGALEIQRFWPDTELAASMIRTSFADGPEYRIIVIGPCSFAFDQKKLTFLDQRFVMGNTGSRKREVSEKDDTLREEFTEEKFDRLVSAIPKFREWSTKLRESGEDSDFSKLLQKENEFGQGNFHFKWEDGKAYLAVVNEHMMNGPQQVTAIYSSDDIDKIEFVANQRADMKERLDQFAAEREQGECEAKERVDKLLDE